MRWCRSHRYDPPALALANRHYNRQKPESPQFVPPGRNLVLLSDCARALWVTSWPLAEYTRHAWAGAWVCQIFRNEGAGLASELIREAVAATRSHFGEPPDLGMITFIEPSCVRPTIVRGREVWGWTWRKVGFAHVGETEVHKRLAFQLLPAAMPAPVQPKPRAVHGLPLFA
jgi:hypothetical protein